MPSQVIVSRTLAKKQMMMSVATKVAIQLNCKLGGEVWTLEIPVSCLTAIVITSNSLPCESLSLYPLMLK